MCVVGIERGDTPGPLLLGDGQLKRQKKNSSGHRVSGNACAWDGRCKAREVIQSDMIWKRVCVGGGGDSEVK